MREDRGKKEQVRESKSEEQEVDRVRERKREEVDIHRKTGG